MAVGVPAQADPATPHGWGYTKGFPYNGDKSQAIRDAAAGTTIPLASFTYPETKTGANVTDVIVGTSPFAPTPKASIVKMLVIPVIVDIGTTSFDPTNVIDACIPNSVTPLGAFTESPLLKPVIFDGSTATGHAARINGVALGKATYPDAVRRAEFWTNVVGTKYHTYFKPEITKPYTISAATVSSLGGGNVITTKCGVLGVLPETAFHNYLSTTVIPSLPKITPTVFPYFVLSNVVFSPSSSLTCTNGCVIGYHGAQGTPVQTYAVGEYDSTSGFWNNQGIKDISIMAHEFSEWLDDPLVNNPTPAWGHIGQVSSCQGNWEVGDPLTGTDFPTIIMANGLHYNPQELAFFSWYYNAETTASLGAGGKFSSNGTFTGPSKPCPPGGTY